MKSHAPVPSATVLPSNVSPDETTILSLADAVPVKVGVLSDVMLSEFEVPESDEEITQDNEEDEFGGMSNSEIKEVISNRKDIQEDLQNILKL